MQSEEIRSRFLKFFEKKGHAIVPSSSLVPQNDPSVLFTTAGMQQFKPYYTAPENAIKDFGNKNIVTVQKCVRTGDIDEVGDETHLTFFEMLGNFSFGGYWKKEAIEYAHEFITKELGLSIDYVSVFKDEVSGIPADEESRAIWAGIDPNLVIKEHNRQDNFWGPTGDEGPCGPTTEIYVNGVEIWNIVFNEYYKTREGKYEPLAVKGIDTGMGLERLAVQVQKKNDVYETDLFEPIISLIKQKREQIPAVSILKGDPKNDSREERINRIFTDHLKTSTFLISDGVLPSNKDKGYILRRLMRRTMGETLLAPFHKEAFQKIEKIYKKTNYKINLQIVIEVYEKELENFKSNLERGLKEINKNINAGGIVTGQEAFNYFSTYGIPKEMFLDSISHLIYSKDENFEQDYEFSYKRHQELSRTSSAGMFKGGLANHNEKTIKHHTAHHLLLAALQEVLGKSVKQKGSNITEERLRMDFSFERKMTDEEKKKVEEIVNNYISQNLSVIRKEMPLAEAEKIGAEMEFGAKYPDIVSVYLIEDKQGNPISKEFCGGPHVE
ncbi:MAG: alanine--tRNA ligase-related protein, partial [Patescibacteria group bacterium]|nr:alanine--tRNA ligase-related protein [Patescibacteria group bacterium]